MYRIAGNLAGIKFAELGSKKFGEFERAYVCAALLLGLRTSGGAHVYVRVHISFTLESSRVSSRASLKVATLRTMQEGG